MTKIVFAPGCFDDFVGTQEELDELIADITQQLIDELDGKECELIKIEPVIPNPAQPLQ